jgi:uncharacterized membrane protein YphA (DoxX/SURF4 family)
MTAGDGGLLTLRIGVAASFFFHGIEKRCYWPMKPGGPNSRAMLRVYRLLSIAEPLGAIAIVSGFLIRYAAIGTALVMLGAIRTRIVVWKKGWGEDDGWEIDGILFAASVALVLLGAGGLSVDALIAK